MREGRQGLNHQIGHNLDAITTRLLLKLLFEVFFFF